MNANGAPEGAPSRTGPDGKSTSILAASRFRVRFWHRLLRFAERHQDAGYDRLVERERQR
jgi:hypothetical protein